MVVRRILSIFYLLSTTLNIVVEGNLMPKWYLSVFSKYFYIKKIWICFSSYVHKCQSFFQNNKNHTVDFPFRNKQEEQLTCPMSITPFASQDSVSMGREWGQKYASLTGILWVSESYNLPETIRSDLEPITRPFFFKPLLS